MARTAAHTEGGASESFKVQNMVAIKIILAATNAKLTFTLIKRLIKNVKPDKPKRINKGGAKVIKPKNSLFQLKVRDPSV